MPPASGHSSNPDRRRRSARIAPARGFTLLEIVLAFSILAIGLTIAMQAATHSMRQAQRAAEQTEVALYAQNLLDSAGLDEPLEPGEDSGEFGDSGYRWTLTVTPYQLPDTDAAAGPELGTGVELLELDLLVEWRRGEQQRESRFRTLRAMVPQPL